MHSNNGSTQGKSKGEQVVKMLNTRLPTERADDAQCGWDERFGVCPTTFERPGKCADCGCDCEADPFYRAGFVVIKRKRYPVCDACMDHELDMAIAIREFQSWQPETKIVN